jgi:hypothetical protein
MGGAGFYGAGIDVTCLVLRDGIFRHLSPTIVIKQNVLTANLAVISARRAVM